MAHMWFQEWAERKRRELAEAERRAGERASELSEAGARDQRIRIALMTARRRLKDGAREGAGR